MLRTAGYSRQHMAAVQCTHPSSLLSVACCCLWWLSLVQKEEVKVKVTNTTHLESPVWNQTRPWLTGSWVMQRPQEFVQEAGGTAGQEQVAPLMDLSLLGPVEADAVLVDDLLTVMMGQVCAAEAAAASVLCERWHGRGGMPHTTFSTTPPAPSCVSVSTRCGRRLVR